MLLENELPNQIAHIATLILREHGNNVGNFTNNIKGAISLNFLARTIRQLNAIHLLSDSGFLSDAWSLHRSIIERYFLFVYLCDKGEFEIFVDWCFKQHYEIENRLKSSKDLKQKEEIKDRKFSEKHKDRYNRIIKNSCIRKWRRPDPENVAKILDLKFIYDIGYDYASSSVHPISEDGFNDYLRLMGRFNEIKNEEKDVLLKNSQLIAVLHIQHFLNQPEYNWRKVLYDLIDAFRMKIGDSKLDINELYNIVLNLWGNGIQLSIPKNNISNDP